MVPTTANGERRPDAFEAILDAMPDVVARFDRAHRLVYVNGAAERVSGRRRAELLAALGDQLGEMLPLVHDWPRVHARVLETGTGTDIDFTQGPRIYHARIVPEPGREAVLVITRDVTDSHLVERARARADWLSRMQRVTEAFSGACVPADLARVLLTEAMQALHADAGVVVLVEGDRLEAAAAAGYPPHVPERWCAMGRDARLPSADAIRARTSFFYDSSDELLARYPALAEGAFARSHAFGAVPLVVGDRAVGAVHLRKPHRFDDDECRFVQALARACAQAMDRARLYEAEARAREEAETASRLKDEFLATMSHELRTPLNAVVGWSTMLHDGRITPASAPRATEALQRNARALARLIDDLLDVSRIVSGKLTLDFETVEVASTIAAALDAVAPAALAKRIDVDVDVDEAIALPADPDRLQQIVWNLASNAVKFTPEGGRVRVCAKREAGHFVLEVTDTGPGIAPDLLPHVFERFRQGDSSTTRRHGGLGLGLAIVRHLVELHGGTVRAESAGPGGGARFVVDLPVLGERPSSARPLRAGASTDPPPVLVDASLSGVRVVVIDDEHDACELARATLSGRGADVVCARSVEEGLARVSEVLPRVVVCDLGMPGEDGFSFIRRLRTFPHDRGGAIPVLALTAYAQPDDAARVLAAGFQRHLVKPIHPDALVRAVAESLS